jgi:hypothetical protein
VVDNKHFEVTFPGFDESKVVNIAIGDVLQSAFASVSGAADSYHTYPLGGSNMNLDSRIQINSPWSSIDETMQSITVFAA